jgi:hypothetical protein
LDKLLDACLFKLSEKACPGVFRSTTRKGRGTVLWLLFSLRASHLPKDPREQQRGLGVAPHLFFALDKHQWQCNFAFDACPKLLIRRPQRIAGEKAT